MEYRSGHVLWAGVSELPFHIPSSKALVFQVGGSRWPPACLLYMPTSIKSLWNWVNNYRFLHGKAQAKSALLAVYFPAANTQWSESVSSNLQLPSSMQEDP